MAGKWDFFRNLTRLVTGHDIFVSYARSDGQKQALALAEELEQHGLSYDFDLVGSDEGVEVPASVLRRVRQASMLVVICTPGAAASKPIQREIAAFLETKRTILFIGDAAAGESLAKGRAVLPFESPGVHVARAFTSTRLMVVRRRLVLASAVAYLIALGIATALLRVAAAKTHAAEERGRAVRYANTAVELRQESIPVRAALIAAAASLRHGSTAEAFEIAQELAPLIPEFLPSINVSGIRSVALAPSADWYAVLTDEAVLLYSEDNRLRWRRKVTTKEQAWLAFSPDETVLAFTTAEADEKLTFHVVALREVASRGMGAESLAIGRAPAETSHLFFASDGRSVFASRESAQTASASTMIFSVDGRGTSELPGLTATDATDKWIVALSERDRKAIVHINRSTNQQTEWPVAGFVRDVKLTGDFEVREMTLSTEAEARSYVEWIDFRSGEVRTLDLSGAFPELVVARGGPSAFGAYIESTGWRILAIRFDDLGGPSWEKRVYAGKAACISADGKTVVGASSWRTTSAWDVDTGEELARFGTEQMLAVSADGQFVLGVSEGRVSRFRVRPPRTDWKPVALSDHGPVVVAERPGTNEKPGVMRFSGRRLYTTTAEAQLLALGASGRRAALAHRGLRFVDLEQKRDLPAPDYQPPPGELIRACAFSGDERWALFAGYTHPSEFRLLLTNVDTGKTRALRDEPALAQKLALSAGGEWIAVSSEDRVALRFNGQAVYARAANLAPVAIAPDDSVAAIGVPGAVILFDLHQKTVRATLTLDHRNPKEIVFRGDSKAFVVVTEDPNTFRALDRNVVEVFDTSGARLAKLFCAWTILDAAWIGHDTIRIVDRRIATRMLTWNTTAAIDIICRAVLRDPQPLPPDLVKKLDSGLQGEAPCAN